MARWTIRYRKLTKNLSSNVAILIFVVYFLTIFVNNGYFNTLRLIAYFNSEQNPPSGEFSQLPRHIDAFILSAYYYEKSKTLGENAVALVLSAHFDLMWKRQLLSVGWNDTTNSLQYLKLERITPHIKCFQIAQLAIGNLLPNMTKLAISLGDKLAEIPFQRPNHIPRPVVTCIAPLFVSEDWRTFLLAVHAYKRFGSFMHLYIRSSIKPIYDLAEIYEKEGYLKIQPWLHLKYSHRRKYSREEDPNISVEFRNQAAAQTDCLLQYKETVDFISFMDLDDILIPRRGSSYIDEFSAIFAASSDLAFITYDKQNIQALSDKNPKLFSLQQIYSTLKFTKFNETGKIVARPELINATWIHWPHMPANSISIPWEDNAIVHMSNIKVISEKFTIMPDQDVIAPKYVFSKGKLTVLSKLDIAEMDKDMKRILSKKKAQKILIEIPQTTLYYDIISQCFQRTFYSFHYSNRIAEMKCPNPDRCQLPNNVKRPCSHATADYHSVLGKDINVHFGVNLRFEHHDRCLY